ESASGLTTHPATTDSTTKTENSPIFGPLIYHDAPVTWKLLVDVPKDAKPADYPISGVLGYQTCHGVGPNRTCELPRAVNFAGTPKVGDQSSKDSAPLTFSPGESYRKAAEAAAIFADNLDRQAKNPPAAPAKTEPSAIRPEAKQPVLRATDQYELSRIV